MSNQSFIPQAFADLCEYKNFKGKHATFISNLPHPTIIQQYAAALASAKNTNNSSIHCLSVFGSIQSLMDKISWNARKWFNANARAAQSELENGGAPWGLEATERVREFVGVDADNEELLKIVQQDFDLLFQLHTTLTQQAVEKQMLSEDWSESLYFFVEDERQPNGDFVIVNRTDNFDDTLTLLDSIAERLREQQIKDDDEDIMKSVNDLVLAVAAQQAAA